MFSISALIFAIAAGLSMVLTAVVRRVAPALGLLDYPDNHRKLHRVAIPLGGGIAVFLATAAVLLGLFLVPSPWRADVRAAGHQIVILLLAGAVIVAVGLVDDRVKLRGRLKLFGQFAAALVLVAGGLVIQRIGIFGQQIDLGLLSIPFTLFWLMGAVNAVNLLDGIDGLATMLGFILVATIAGMAALVGQMHVFVIAVVFAGSLLGFLRYNFPPATIFLGDAGSMLIGLVVGALAISGSLKGPGTVLLAAPLAVWTIPIFDSVAAILRRKLSGRSIYTTDRGHIHHRLLSLLGSSRRVLAGLAICCALTSTATLVSVYRKNDLIALLACSAIVVMFIATGIFGRAEVSLLTGRLRKLGMSLLEPGTSHTPRIRESAVQLQGSRPWGALWATLTESAEKLALTEIRLDVNLPRFQEGYHAFWELPAIHEYQQRWRMEIPLVIDDQMMGHLTVVGQHGGQSAHTDIARFLTLLETFEAQLRAMAQHSATMPEGNGIAAAHEASQQPMLSIFAQPHPK
jgi:UDP-GlcNAc:undecaprenyl-phosphate GlcNAc-1-phosphate transferase